MPIVSGILGASGATRAGNAINNTAIAAEHGILNATQNGQTGVQNQLDTNATNVNNAGKTAIGDVNDATGAANTTLANSLNNISGNLNPYLQGGQQGVSSLAQYAASNPQFNFDPSKYLNSAGMQFQEQQGDEAINNNAAAQGLGSSGNTLKALSQYNQGLASTYYNNAFNQAQSQFQTNQNTTLANLSTLINSGLNASNQFGNANTSLGALQAQNTLGAGYYGGNTTTGLAQYLASQGTQGQEFNAGLGLQGSEEAGNFAMQGAQGRAAGIMGSNKSLGNLFGGLAGGIWNAIPNFPGSDVLGSVLGMG